jgi:DNA-binding transcriptional ArsR family regulator
MGMLRVDVNADDLLHTRFALSPVFELNSLLRRLEAGTAPGWSAAHIDRLRPRFERLRGSTALDAVLALKVPDSGANFVAPPPQTASQTFDDDLAAIRATPAADARAEIDFYLARRPSLPDGVRRILTSPAAVSLLAEAIETAWTELLADDWPRVRTVCERDVVHRTGQLSRSGWAAALAGLAPQVRWHNSGIELPGFSDRKGVVSPRGAGVLFIPSVFIWPDVAAHLDDPTPKTVIYPARGAATFFSTPEAPVPDALAALIGRSRARLLLALATPATTTQLGHGLDLPLGTISDHLSVLRRARLVRRTRVGRSVRYERTPLGESLVSPDDQG